MNTQLTINITFNNTEKASFTGELAFSIMDQGILFVEGEMIKSQETSGLIVKKVVYKNVRNWFPLANVKSIEVLSTKTMDDPEEIRKWEKFKEHNIDIMVTKISHTEEPDTEHVEKNIRVQENGGSDKCRHCKHPIKARNPSGFCDHLYYPENCDVCKRKGQSN